MFNRVTMDQVQPMIDQLPPLAKADLLNDLKNKRPDKDLITALELTLAAAARTGLDGEALYEVAEHDILAHFGLA